MRSRSFLSHELFSSIRIIELFVFVDREMPLTRRLHASTLIVNDRDRDFGQPYREFFVFVPARVAQVFTCSLCTPTQRPERFVSASTCSTVLIYCISDAVVTRAPVPMWAYQSTNLLLCTASNRLSEAIEPVLAVVPGTA